MGDSPANTRPRLVVIYGHDRGRAYTLDQGQTTIGRTERAHVRVDHDSVSRLHATIVVDEWGVRVRDEASTNGTFVNHQPVHEALLKPGDLIKIGHSMFKFVLAACQSLTPIPR